MEGGRSKLGPLEQKGCGTRRARLKSCAYTGKLRRWRREVAPTKGEERSLHYGRDDNRN